MLKNEDIYYVRCITCIFDLMVFSAYVLFIRMQLSSQVKKNPYKQIETQVLEAQGQSISFMFETLYQENRLFV